MLTLRDLQSNKSHAVSPAGSIIGREGGDADITVRTASVSKKHARVFFEDGAWFLEDMRSANGTFIDNEKIAEPHQLQVKTVFDLAGYRFEVASIVEDQEEAGEDEDASGRTFTGTSPEPPPEPKRPAPRLGPGGRPPPRAAAPDQGKTTAGKPAKPAPKPTMEQSAFEDDDPPADAAEKSEGEEQEEPANSGESPTPEGEPEDSAASTSQQKGVEPAAEEAGAAANPDDLKDPKAAAGKVMKDLPKAIAYYMAAVPKLLFNPKGTILKSVDDQKFPGIDGLPLIAWALPGMAGAVAVQMVCSFIALLITTVRTGFSFGAILMSLIMMVVAPVISGVVGGLIVAFLYHRVMAWIIKLLKGESDLKSRTNYLIFFQGIAILTIVPTAAGILFGALTFIPFVGPLLMLVPIVLQLAASLISLGATYVWFKYFKVHPIIPKIILVLAALAALGTVFQSLGAIGAAISSIRGGGSAVSAADVKDAAAAAAAAAGDEDSTDAQPLDPKIKKQIEDAKKAGAKALADAQKAGKEAAEAGKDAVEDGAKDAKEAAEKAGEKIKEAVKAEKQPKEASKKEPAAEPEPEPKKVAATPTPGPDAEGSNAAPAETGDQTPYQRWAAKRNAVEKALDADPTLLSKDQALAALYRQFSEKQREIRKKIGGKTGIAEDDLFSKRKAEAETFSQTGKLMDELYSKVHK
ncbi:MAG: FHA domain-containing protein [Myxococcales bacterium]